MTRIEALVTCERNSLGLTALKETVASDHTINDGFFVNSWDENKWGNLPASYHNGSANIHFADGHIESHRWAVGDTVRPAKEGGAGGGFVPVPPTDYNWLKQRVGTRK